MSQMIQSDMPKYGVVCLSLLYISSYMGICDVRVWYRQRDVSSVTEPDKVPPVSQLHATCGRNNQGYVIDLSFYDNIYSISSSSSI